MGKELVVDFSDSGAVQAMHMDGFDLSFLGDKQVERASEITFDSITQLWDIYSPPPGQESQDQNGWVTTRAACGYSSYEIARDVEVDWFNRARCLSVHPLSDAGLACLEEARASKSIL